MAKVKDKVRAPRRGRTRVSQKHQVTLPVDALRAAGIVPGDQLVAHADGTGRIVLERVADPVSRWAGAMTGTWPEGHLDALRDEWD